MAERCKHVRFSSVIRVVETTVSDPKIRTLTALVKVICKGCGRPFVWKAPRGFSTSMAMADPDGTILRAPLLHPITEDQDLDEDYVVVKRRKRGPTIH